MKKECSKLKTDKDIELLNALASRLKGECQRLARGVCTSYTCMQRGGYAGKTVNYNMSICEKYEQYQALTRAVAAMEGKVVPPKKKPAKKIRWKREVKSKNTWLGYIGRELAFELSLRKNKWIVQDYQQLPRLVVHTGYATAEAMKEAKAAMEGKVVK